MHHSFRKQPVHTVSRQPLCSVLGIRTSHIPQSNRLAWLRSAVPAVRLLSHMVQMTQREKLTMITASMESLCAIAHTPTAKTLKLAQAKEMGSPTMDPLQAQRTQESQARCICVQNLDQDCVAWLCLRQERREIPQARGERSCARTHHIVKSQCTRTMACDREGKHKCWDRMQSGKILSRSRPTQEG